MASSAQAARSLPLAWNKEGGGALKDMARTVFARAHGLLGHAAEDHAVLYEEVQTQTGCSYTSYCELIYKHSYDAELKDLRQLVPDYPPKEKRVRPATDRGRGGDKRTVAIAAALLDSKDITIATTTKKTTKTKIQCPAYSPAVIRLPETYDSEDAAAMHAAVRACFVNDTVYADMAVPWLPHMTDVWRIVNRPRTGGPTTLIVTNTLPHFSHFLVCAAMTIVSGCIHKRVAFLSPTTYDMAQSQQFCCVESMWMYEEPPRLRFQLAAQFTLKNWFETDVVCMHGSLFSAPLPPTNWSGIYIVHDMPEQVS
jgi:hypothetical protein